LEFGISLMENLFVTQVCIQLNFNILRLQKVL